MSKWRAIDLSLLICSCVVQNAAAANFQIDLRTSVSQATVGDSLVYTIIVTNLSGIQVPDVTVIDTVPDSVTIGNVATSQGTYTTINRVVTFAVGPLFNGQSVTNTIQVVVNAAGMITNFVGVTGSSLPTETTNITTTVVPAPQAVLQGVIQPDPGQVFVNDSLRYSIFFTNTGTSTAQNVVVSNAFSTNVLVRSVSPSGTIFTFTNNSLLLTAGTVTTNATGAFFVVIQPTNAGILTVTATFSGSNIDTNSTTSGSFQETILEPDTNQLQATIVSVQTFDPQSGLMRQTIQLSNIGTQTVSSARVVVSGLTNQLYNAVGTNGNDPFVVYSGSLGVGECVQLILEYFNPSRVPGADPTLTAYPVDPIDLTAPANSPPTIKQIADLGGGRALIEFQSEPGRSYVIVYSDNTSFTNALRAQPTIVAPANRVQWIDEGPPKTISRLTNGSVRCYRVIAQ